MLWQLFLGSIAEERVLRRFRRMRAEHADRTRLNELSGAIIGWAFTVLNTLAAGFPEKVYENALALELRKARLAVAQQCGATVTYDDTVAGEYFLDLLVEDAVLAELKTVKALVDAHRLECVNYLKATDLHLCLLLNFGNSRLEIERVVNRMRSVPSDLRVPRASPEICVKILRFCKLARAHGIGRRAAQTARSVTAVGSACAAIGLVAASIGVAPPCCALVPVPLVLADVRGTALPRGPRLHASTVMITQNHPHDSRKTHFFIQGGSAAAGRWSARNDRGLDDSSQAGNALTSPA